MNVLPVFVKRVMSGPTRYTSENVAGFKVIVLAGDGYGPFKKQVLWFTHLKEAKKVKPGYSLGYH